MGARERASLPAEARGGRYRRSEGGQSVLEFALLLPVAMFLLIGIIDVGRIFTTMLTIESAARQAADFGAYGSSNWTGDSSDPSSNHAKTVAAMIERVCVSSRHLSGYVGAGSTCTNPQVTSSLIEADGSPATGCDDANREPPCRVKVDVDFRFELLVAVDFEALGQRFGLPVHLDFERTSIFPMSDFELSEP